MTSPNDALTRVCLSEYVARAAVIEPRGAVTVAHAAMDAVRATTRAGERANARAPPSMNRRGVTPRDDARANGGRATIDRRDAATP